MGSPFSPLIAHLFMEGFEVKVFSSCLHPPTLWLRFVDDTFVIIKAEHSQPLLQHINSQDQHIQFTVEEPSQQGTLPYIQGTGERFKKVCKSKGMQVHFKGTDTLKTLQVTPKDKDKITQKWCHLPLQVPHINCPDAYRIRQGTGRRDQGTSLDPFFNSPAQQFHRTSTKLRMFQHYTQGNTRFCQEHQGSNVYMCQLPLFKQKPWEISIATCLGQHVTGHTSVTMQAIQLHPPQAPLQGPSLPQVPQPSQLLTANQRVGDICPFLG